jgi:Zn-dependent peptidase ImmA (M78 family)
MRSSWNTPPKREPILSLGIQCARVVRQEIGYDHPTELELEVIAHIRGALVRASPTTGSRACLMRVGDRGVIGVACGLSDGERRWAIAHELGHFEAHSNVSYLGLCTGEDLRSDYGRDGREPEANAFAAELLLPEDLVRKRCDVAEVKWDPIERLAEDFQVSLMAAARRFVIFTDDRVAVVCCKEGKVAWSDGNRAFGRRPARGAKVDQWSLAYDFFTKGDVTRRRETVSAGAWIADVSDNLELVEHVIPMPRLGLTFSLLWFPPS